MDSITNNGHKKVRSVQPFKQFYRNGMTKALDLLAKKELTHFDFAVMGALMVATKKGNVLDVTHQEVADTIKASRVAVTRSFKRLKAHSLIDNDLNGKICLSSNLIWGGKISDRFWPFKKEIR